MRFDPQSNIMPQEHGFAAHASSGRGIAKLFIGALTVLILSGAAVAGWFWLATGTTPVSAMASLTHPEEAAAAEDTDVGEILPASAPRPALPGTVIARGASKSKSKSKSRQKAVDPDAAEEEPALTPAQKRGHEALASGRSLMARGRPKAAVAVLEEAVKLLPDNADAHYRLALAYIATSNLDAAQRERAALEQIDRNLASLLGNLIR